tara:strand:- start:13 stop:1164 length:1152 start_codon:yes stop_codon:yes gene_type:complete
LKTLDYRVAGTYVTGKSHIKKDKPCQDRIYSKSLNGVTVVSLADGAGSCSKSEVGAEIVTKYVVEFICDNYDVISQKEKGIISKTILEGILDRLSKKAKALDTSLKDLSSTLLFVAVKDNQYLAGHIGDGLIGYFDNENNKVLSYPENGEYPNQTFFTTSKNALNHFRIYKNNLDHITGFILMSDGSFDCLYDKNKNRLTDANKTIFSWLQNGSNTIDEVEKALKDNIESEFLKKTHDDCSIILLTLTEDKIKVKEAKKIDLTLDLKQLADNTKRIVRLEEDVSSVNNDFKKYKSVLDKSTSNQADNTNRINQLQENVTSTKNELKDFQNEFAGKLNKSDSDQESVLTEDMKSIIKWKQNVNILLLIISTGLAGIIIKLLFFN